MATSLLSRDSRGNVTNETTSVGGESFALVRGFDEAGRGSSVNEAHYSYAEDGLLAGVSNAAAVVTYDYAPDRADAGYEITLANGTTITRRIQREAYRRALATNITTSVNGATVETLAYTYDALGRPVSRNADTFSYNARSEVVFSRGDAENAENTYAYDYIGNLTLHESPAATNAYTANNLNQYTAISNLCASVPLCETNPAYDTDGNLVSDGVFAYAYDSANRLTSVSSNGISVAAFAYDAKSRRVRKTTPSATHTYFYDDWNLVEERIVRTDGTATINRYVWGKDLSGTLQGAGGVGGLLAVLRSDPASTTSSPNLSTFQPYFPCYDNNGNVTRYLDASGATVAAYAYDAFGRTVTATGPLADVFPYRFSTKYFDLETGLYYYGYRYYSPTLMRWFTRDPIEEDGGYNLFSICQNNPMAFVDKFGEDIYLYNGNNSGQYINDRFHQTVAVDVWSDRCSPEKIGIQGYSFGYNDDWAWNWPNGKWLGKPGLSLPGYFMVGEIYRAPVIGKIVGRKTTTPEYDKSWREKMERRVGEKDVYSVGRHNCRAFAQTEFNAVP